MYSIELWRHGLVDNINQDDVKDSGNSMSTAQKRERLQEYVAALRKPDLGRLVQDRVSVDRGKLWDLYGGMLVNGNHECKKLSFYSLPRRGEDMTAKASNITTGYVIADLGIDPSQDLVALIEGPTHSKSSSTIRLCSIDSGKHHRLAKKSVIKHTPDISTQNYTYDISISSRYLAILFSSDKNKELAIWNWKTGTLKLRLVGRSLQSFSFWTSHHVLLAVVDTEGNDQPELRIMKFDQSGRKLQIGNAPYLCSFLYPSLAEGATSIRLRFLGSNPVPNWMPRPDPKFPFFLDGQNRAFIVRYDVTNGLKVFTFFLGVPYFTFQSCLDILHICPEKPKRFIWEYWGMKGSRMLPLKVDPDWERSSYGSMFAYLKSRRRSAAFPAKQELVLWDFNPQVPSLQDETQDEPNVIENHIGIFEDDVISNLPVKITSFPLPSSLLKAHPFDGVLLHDRNVILVEARSTHIS
ncbi:hypothetical protein JAAARDRAFT_60818 [Jaapia argillacea MUCL 33604]|uniref:Uncharacterized protein n=1 Tax=Jaapia argillacea MUCL 33604 TaxID=933084 RepID=A0A067PRU7_9AGAM|nr:hypothetical protein JAAARDRAFT_60818 [Jaapia argillacea MUCL 33604]